ncbi:MAG TPA: choice-of-anchor tandem repeat GloVer-containing protein, partial [Phycisphaerae bacterium]|nr:choice-of-anchor tandem repeat GloVer-containing protein [Phycisphaerae bacterium]
YGMTQFGGANGGPNSKGTIFAYNIATGVETVLYSFTGGSDGRNPVDSLIKSGSTLYGMTEYGGSGNEGTLFAYNLDNSTETVLLSFSFRINGGIPEGSLIESGSTLYGTTGIGGHRTNGTIFALTLPKP